MKKIILLSLIVIIPSVALAEKDPHQHKHPHGKFGHKLFYKQDTNHDRVITRAEVFNHHKKHFDQVDTNHDGKMTRKEAKTAGQLHSYKALGVKTHKGYLTVADTFSLEKKRFDAADSNSDGQITKKEFKAHYLISFQK